MQVVGCFTLEINVNASCAAGRQTIAEAVNCRFPAITLKFIYVLGINRQDN